MAGQSAQIVQQIETLLAQLAQEEPDPAIQRLIKQAQAPIEQLQQAAGKDDMEDMQSGLAAPGGMGEGPPAEEGGGLGGPPGGGPEPGERGGEGGEHPALVIHIGAPSKSFKGANKAAMANMRERGHFNPRGAPGEEQRTERTRAKARG